MPHQLGHLNYAPKTVGENIDKWHVDTLRYDYVMFVTDPTRQKGGEFQYFKGTKSEAETARNKGIPLPAEKIVSPKMPGAGYAIMQQGNMVVHRGAKLNEPYDRVTMVNAYVPLDTELDDPSRFSDLKTVDPHQLLFPEWARHKAWLSRGKLNRLIEKLPFTDDKDLIINELKGAIRDVETAIKDLNDSSEGEQNYYGDLEKEK